MLWHAVLSLLGCSPVLSCALSIEEVIGEMITDGWKDTRGKHDTTFVHIK